MAKRFTVRPIKAKSYSRQGWVLNEVQKYAVYDREWRKSAEAKFGFIGAREAWELDPFKYIETAYSKEVAQFWAKWLNENKASEYGYMLSIPGSVFQEGLDLMKKINTEAAA